ncbi:uncharacterized protein LOC118448693 isoform X1 [Vespa mandarinia]|uniref:uncharacterized protein LOC118448693 isoform X1 n=1 Tax=Vespa mandarinia TaxID=7446 RepID=UPI001616E572|nr:uncharacterized protein LOC118448693 isoform X1 [Vespa mandarinia]
MKLKFYCHLDHGNEFTTIKIQVGFSEKILANDTQEPVAASTFNTYMKKSYSISCCMNTPPQDVCSQTVITELLDQKSMPSQLSKHSLSELYDNDHNSYITSCQYASNQYMEIHHDQSTIPDTFKCQCLNELEMPEKILSCTVANDSNCNMEKSANSTINMYDKANKDTINDINDKIQNIYVRNITTRLGDSNNGNSMLNQAKNRPSTIDAYCKEHSKFHFCTDSKIISGIENVVSNKEIKQIHLYKQNEHKHVWKNSNYTYLSDTIMKSVEKNADNISCQEEKNIEFDNYTSANIETSNDLQNNTKSSSSDTIIIAFSKPKFKQILSEIKEHTRSLEKQIRSINNIIENITVLSEQKAHLSSKKENFTIFYEKRYTYSNESQTDEFVDINKRQIEKNMEGSNLCKYIKKCALFTSSLTEKFSIYQEPIATSTKEKLLENDNTVDHCMRQQYSMFEQNSSYEEEKKEFPTTEIIADIVNHKPDKINTKSAPYMKHKIEQVPLYHSHDKNMSKFKTNQMKLSVESKTRKNYCDQMDCNTAIPYHSTMKTTVSNHDTIYGLYLETAYTQSSNFQIVAATSASSLKLNSNTMESNYLTKSEKSTSSRNLTEKSNNKVSPDTLDISTMVDDDLNPSISIQCITINLSNCHADPHTTKRYKCTKYLRESDKKKKKKKRKNLN